MSSSFITELVETVAIAAAATVLGPEVFFSPAGALFFSKAFATSNVLDARSTPLSMRKHPDDDHS